MWQFINKLTKYKTNVKRYDTFNNNFKTFVITIIKI